MTNVFLIDFSQGAPLGRLLHLSDLECRQLEVLPEWQGSCQRKTQEQEWPFLKLRNGLRLKGGRSVRWDSEGVREALAKGRTTGKTFRCSNALRWRKPNNNEVVALMEATHGKHAPVLQQAWECIETGEVDWRDVPTETPNVCGMPPRSGRT